ncbi:restriction endonuclease [Campylobacter sp. RM10543]|uniref:restriction endonuclease n=1 Tax=Campylobacter molothri TaxID=1032242 RepID=UPI00301DF330|nr:restriction endonuclease [Campylobacter sp. RM10543]
MLSKITCFLNDYNYDIKITRNARWIDQKCTCDVLSIIADCILEYTQYQTNKAFSINDIWQSKYTQENVVNIFSKPDVNSQFAKNEYDKFFSQPIKLFEYSRILKFLRKDGNSNIYAISNLELLEFISLRDFNALMFLTLYIKKVLMDSGLYDCFLIFFQNQNKNSFKKLKDIFIDFTIRYTPINQSIECGRIFTKILNPLAFELKKYGSRKGRLSDTIITFDELKYNRINWRDELSGKDKLITRYEYEMPEFQGIREEAKVLYNIQKAKKIVRRYNDKYNGGLSKVKSIHEKVPATQIHHIFPTSDFPSISDFIENLIALTPNQHFIQAHPNNQTNYINKDFQYICLIAKLDTIIKDETQTYSFENYRIVLNIGLYPYNFDGIFDYYDLIEKLDQIYSVE